jgi:hypothetical protein
VKKGQRFVFTHKEGFAFGLSMRIIKDTQTGVLYLYTSEGYGTAITPLLDSDGKPIVESGRF